MKLVFQIIFLFTFFTTFGQSRYRMGESPVVVTCSGIFEDSGGVNDSYEPNESSTMVICSDETAGTHIKLIFSDIDVPHGDSLCFYDGNNLNAPKLTCGESVFSGRPFVIQATATNTSGCITMSFNSDSFLQGRGWNALIECVPACQLIQVGIEQSDPPAIPQDTGWIDICVGEEVSFVGKGIFPQNGLIYEHSEATSTFEWDFGDGMSASGVSANHTYNKPGGYKVELAVTDQFGCRSSNFITQRVRVSTDPIFNIKDNLSKEMCLGDTIRLIGGVAGDESANITTETTAGTFQTTGFRSDSLALPDGNGRSYETSISFSDYRPGDVLTKVEDLNNICLNMEHSWLHDMEIFITCPNGRKAVLQAQQLINDEIFLGFPVDADGVNPTPGQGRNYCWSPTSTNGTLTQVANRENQSAIGDPFYLPEGTYSSFEPLTQLVGCPLNGEWTITVTDLWEQDNGWIFSWGIEFNPELIPELEIYQPDVASFQWADHPSIIQGTPADKPTSIVAVPSQPGIVSYQFESIDNHGCSADTTVEVTILPSGHESCLRCESNLFAYDEIIACEGTEVNLGVYINPSVLDAKVFEKEENIAYGFTSGEASISSTINVSGVTSTSISNDLEELVSVCVELETDFAEDITLFLRAPSGKVMVLTQENGGNSDNYSQTCFNPLATKPIQEGIGPFRDVFLPEDDFSTLVGENINGDWILTATSPDEPQRNYLLKSWSIAFHETVNGTYQWTPGVNISSTVGTHPILKMEENTAPFYILTKEENDCTSKDSIKVTVISANVPIDVEYINLANGEILFYWSPIENAKYYEVSTDGINWRRTDDNLYHMEVGFQNGQSQSFQFRAIYSNQNCTTNSTTIVANYLFCDLEATILTQNLSVSCYNETDGRIEVRASGGTPPYLYRLNNSLEQVNGTFNNLSAGTYQLLVSDESNLCGDTLNIEILNPEPIGVSFDIRPPSCHDIIDGSIIATPFGGRGGFTNFSWQNRNDTTNTIRDLSTGSYIFTIQDANGCTYSDTASMEAPLPLELLPSQVPVSCFGGNDGSAGVKVDGGTPFMESSPPEYTYLWNNSQTTPDAIGLSIGQYNVTVIDANGCSETATTEVTQPTPISTVFDITPPSCNDSLDAIIIAQVSGGISPYEYKWENGQNSKLNFGLDAGTYLVTITDQQGCSTVESSIITPAQPMIISPIITPPLCNGTATGVIELVITEGNAPYQYTWSDSITSSTDIASGLKAGTYTVTIQDVNKCEMAQDIVVPDTDSITITTTSINANCLNVADGIGEISVNGGTMPYTFIWENGHQEARQEGLLPGTYPFTVTDANNCSILDSIVIETTDPLRVDSFIMTMPACQGESNGSIIAIASGGTAPYTYLWEGNIQQNPLEGVASGLYSLSISDDNGCELVISDIELSEPPLMTVSTSAKDVQCFGEDTGQAIALPMGGIPPYAYRWSDDKDQRDSLANNLTTGTYTVTVEDQNGCQEQASVFVPQPEEALSLAISQTKMGCAGMEENEANIIALGGTGNNYRYKWSTLPDTTATVSALIPNTYFVTVTDERDCEQFSSIEIEELQTIEVNLVTRAPSCFNTTDGSIVITEIQGGIGEGDINNYSFLWHTNAQTPIIENLAGDSVYQLTITDAQNCSSIIERYLSSPEEIELDYNIKDLTCYESNEGAIEIVGTTNDAIITNYTWDNNINATNTPSVENLAAGDYALTVTTDNDCEVTMDFTIQQPEAILLTDVSLNSNICPETPQGSISFQVSGGMPNYAFNWSNGSTQPTLSNLNKGNYTVTISDNNNCTLEETFIVEGPDSLLGTINIEPTVCFGDKNGRVTLAPIGGTPPYTYSLDGNEYQSNNVFIGLTTGVYTAHIRDDNGCIWRRGNVAIDPGEVLLVEIVSEADELILGDSVILSANISSNQGEVLLDWASSPIEDFVCLEENCERILTKPKSSTKFEVNAIDDAGCEAVARYFLRISNPKKVFIPTGFSPNEDGFNDVLRVHGEPSIRVNYLRIFDRWGEEVFYAYDFFVNDPAVFWNGTFRGDALNSGVYTWIMEVEYIDQQKEIFRGNTTLLK